MSADASLPVKAFDDVQFDEFYERALPVDGYGLGLFDVADPYAPGVGYTGGNLGYASWAGCLSDGSVVVVLTNREVDDIGGMARPTGPRRSPRLTNRHSLGQSAGNARSVQACCLND